MAYYTGRDVDVFWSTEHDSAGIHEHTDFTLKHTESFNLSDDSYENASTEWDLYLYDVQTYTNITVNTALSNTELPSNSRIRGRSSGATGFAVAAGGGGTSVNITQTSLMVKQLLLMRMKLVHQELYVQ